MAQKDLSKTTASKLREIALQLGSIEGVHGMTKRQLIEAIKSAQGALAPPPDKKIETDVKALKGQIENLKTEKKTAIVNRDRKAVKDLRKKIKRLKRTTRQAS